MNPTTLMIEDTLRAAERGITTALRQLKDLEAPIFATAEGRHPGGPHRSHAMVMLRVALAEVHRALLNHVEESAFRLPVAGGAWTADAKAKSVQ